MAYRGGSGLRTRNAMDRVLGGGDRQKSYAGEGSWAQRIVGPRLRTLVDSTNLSQGTESAVRQRLLRAGFPYGLSAKDFITLKRILAVAIPVLLISFNGLVSRFIPLLNTGVYGYGGAIVIGFFVGFIAPDFWLMSVVRKRRHMMQKALPDVIDLICVSVEAGLGLIAAMQEVATRFRGPLGDELMRVLSELRVGKSFAQALRDMATRLGIEDFSQFASQIIQAEQLGISIGNALRAQSQIMREKRKQRAEEQAQKAPVKMMIPLILFILPTLFIVIMGPAAIMGYEELSRTGFM